MPKPPKLGRPTAMTEAVLNKLESAFMLGCTDNEACLYANISAGTLYKYQVDNPEYNERKAVLKDTPLLLARQSVINGLSKDPAHSLKVMERLSKDYKQKQEVELNSDSFESILTKLKQGGGE